MAGAPNIHQGDHVFLGAVSVTSINLPDGSISKEDIEGDAGIEASKFVRHQSIDMELAESATAIAAVTKLLHIVKGATGTLVGFEAAVITPADDGSRTVNVDLKKSTGGGSFSSVLASTIQFTNASVAKTSVAGSITSPSVVDGDILEVTVAVAGGSGNQAKGLIVTLTYEEEYA